MSGFTKDDLVPTDGIPASQGQPIESNVNPNLLAAGDDNTGTRYNRYDAYYSIGSASTYNISVSHSGSSAYTLSGSDRGGSVSGNNAAVDLNVGDTVNFSVNASGHPFWIKTTNSTGTGNGASGVSNNGSESGTVSWTPDTAGTYYYICQYHSSMVGQINVTSTSSVESEDITFSGTSNEVTVTCLLYTSPSPRDRG